MKIAVILRKKYGRRALEQISKKFETVSFKMPDELPEIIDDTESIEIPDEIFDSDIILSYALHPDVNYEVIRRSKGRKVKYIILPGGAKSGSAYQLKKLGEEVGVRVLWEDICCATPLIKDRDLIEFFKSFGMPEFEIRVKNGIIEDVKVKRSAICGSSYFVAEKIKGLRIEDAPTKAGYFTQIYPCFATRGLEGGIHRAANIHKSQVEKAIRKALEEYQEK